MRRLALALYLLPGLAFGSPVEFPTATPFAFVAASGDNEQEVSTGTRTLFGIQCESIASAAAMWLKAYNGAPTMGTAAAVDQWAIPAASSTGGTGIVWSLPNGVPFTNGLYIALTGGQALNDNTSVSAGAANCTVYYR